MPNRMNGRSATMSRRVAGVAKKRAASSSPSHRCSGRNPTQTAVTPSHTARAHSIMMVSRCFGKAVRDM